MKFLLDEHLPRSLARWIARQGHESFHVLDVALGGRPDIEIVRWALLHQAVIVTKDADYRAPPLSEHAVQILWVHLGNLRSDRMIEHFAAQWDGVVERLRGGEQIVRVF
jgi:predicted nuclease of predicted toxin-antitoxin system